MAVNQNIYPHSAQVRALPLYLMGIGGSEYQCHIKLPECCYNTKPLEQMLKRFFYL